MALDLTVAKVRDDLRISHTDSDEDIAYQIDECLADLGIAGVECDEEDPNVFAAVRLYVRAGLSDTADDYTKWINMYDRKKAALQTASGYGL